mmetsp:Transcript_115328/g.288189  ORF Transcript_115328/g.288189 Transcript_115328/m.288189 type:complete len:204 (-) Transcript_115328:77-688(-)
MWRARGGHQEPDPRDHGQHRGEGEPQEAHDLPRTGGSHRVPASEARRRHGEGRDGGADRGHGQRVPAQPGQRPLPRGRGRLLHRRGPRAAEAQRRVHDPGLLRGPVPLHRRPRPQGRQRPAPAPRLLPLPGALRLPRRGSQVLRLASRPGLGGRCGEAHGTRRRQDVRAAGEQPLEPLRRGLLGRAPREGHGSGRGVVRTCDR